MTSSGPSNPPPEPARTTWNPETYDEQWKKMAAAGKDPHGEVAFAQRCTARHNRALDPVLDAGCGTGRVAVEFDIRGYVAEGTDLDETMLEAAHAKAPHLPWHQGDLATLELGKQFNTVLAAGNVILFVDPASRPAAAAGMAKHVAPGGLLIAGMQLAREDGRHVPVDTWTAWIADAGLTEIERWGTWNEDPYVTTTSDYIVTVFQRK